MFEVEEQPIEFPHDYAEYLHSLGELSHKPIDGPREAHVGENVFAFEWEMLHISARSEEDPPNVLLANILYPMQRRIAQRHASVAASFITWLGTNCGACYLGEAKTLQRKWVGVRSRDAYVAAWAIENIRRPYVNNGTRTIEHVLASGDDYCADMFTGMWGLRRAPEISIEDMETIDHVAMWLGSPRAQEFIARCNYLIQVRQRFDKPSDTIRAVVGAQA